MVLSGPNTKHTCPWWGERWSLNRSGIQIRPLADGAGRSTPTGSDPLFPFTGIHWLRCYPCNCDACFHSASWAVTANHNFITSNRPTGVSWLLLLQWQMRIMAVSKHLDGHLLLFLLYLKMFSGWQIWQLCCIKKNFSPGGFSAIRCLWCRPSSPILPFLVIFLCLHFCCAPPSVFPELVKSVLSIRSTLCLDFTPGTLHLVSKTAERYASLIRSSLWSWMFVKQHRSNSMNWCTNLNSPYPFGIVKGSESRERHGENILSIYRILAVRHRFVLPMM